MAVANAIRLLSISLMIALSAPIFGGQSSPASNEDAQQGTGADVALSRSKTLAETPPKPPKVVCNGGLLSISADNSTLGSVLRAVRGCGGVRIDMPEGSSGTRIYEQLGPGPVREVLESLLSGTEFNYVIGMSDSNPSKVESVLLMSRTHDSQAVGNTAPTDLAALTPARRLWLQTSKNGRAIARTGGGGRQPESDSGASTETDDAVPAPADVSGAGVSPMDAGIQAQAAEELQVPPNASIGRTPPDAAPDPTKGTQDKITDMQQMFEQRRKMTESQSAAAKPQ